MGGHRSDEAEADQASSSHEDIDYPHVYARAQKSSNDFGEEGALGSGRRQRCKESSLKRELAGTDSLDYSLHGQEPRK